MNYLSFACAQLLEILPNYLTTCESLVNYKLQSKVCESTDLILYSIMLVLQFFDELVYLFFCDMLHHHHVGEFPAETVVIALGKRYYFSSREAAY